jgi:uncharacterized protein YjcR
VDSKEKDKLLKTLTKIVGMAFTRDTWIMKARQFLEGALGEYAKQRYALLSEMPIHDWTGEVKNLLDQIEDLFDEKDIKTKAKFDRNKAFKEAFKEASLAQDQVLAAKNTFINRYLKKDKIKTFMDRIQPTPLRSKELIVDMLLELAPSLAKRLKIP